MLISSLVKLIKIIPKLFNLFLPPDLEQTAFHEKTLMKSNFIEVQYARYSFAHSQKTHIVVFFFLEIILLMSHPQIHMYVRNNANSYELNEGAD